MTDFERSQLIELAEGLRNRAKACRDLAESGLEPVAVARLAGKAVAYEHAAELLMAEMELLDVPL